MNEQHETIKKAFAAHLMSGYELLIAWKAALSAARAEELAAFEAKGLRLGLALTIPADRWIAQVTLLDQAGGVVVLAAIELAGGSLAVN